MKISSDIVGRTYGPERNEVDKRWLMAYNAALGEVSAIPHPLFSVCYEWNATRGLREATGLQALNARLVHAQHDLIIHRPPAPGEALAVAACVVGAAQRRPGTFVVFRLQARGADGKPVSSTEYGMLYRGVTLDGGDRAVEKTEGPPPQPAALERIGDIAVAATAAHVYTECARIWNPIHTDPEYARAAGLPGIILHGTATLALTISSLLRNFGIEPGRVRRVCCRFSGMVLVPSTLAVHAAREAATVRFETRNDRDQPAIARGLLLLE